MVRFSQRSSSAWNFGRGSFAIFIVKTLSPTYVHNNSNNNNINFSLIEKWKFNFDLLRAKEITQSSGIIDMQSNLKMRKPCIPVCWAWILCGHHRDLFALYQNLNTENEKKNKKRLYKAQRGKWTTTLKSNANGFTHGLVFVSNLRISQELRRSFNKQKITLRKWKV